MRIKLANQDKEKLIKLLEVKEENIALASMFNELCFSLDQFNELKNVKDEELNKIAKSLFFDYFELDENNEDNNRIANVYLKDAFHQVDASVYENNPYKINVKIENIRDNGYFLHYLTYPKYSFFPLDDISVNDKDYYREYSSLGFLKEDYSYLTLSKNNNIWMCITPNEINTMQKHIDNAKGNVLVFGLGLGYFPYMVSLKKDVKKITIIERDESIINLFLSNLYPQFINKDKIEIVQDDAFNFLKKNDASRYDYAFFDLWHNAEDGLPLYIKIKELHLQVKQGYWIEESLISMYRRCLLTVIEESLQGYTDDDYRKNKNAIDKIINNIYFKTKNVTFNTYQEIYKYLSKENIIKLIEH